MDSFTGTAAPIVFTAIILPPLLFFLQLHMLILSLSPIAGYINKFGLYRKLTFQVNAFYKKYQYSSFI